MSGRDPFEAMAIALTARAVEPITPPKQAREPRPPKPPKPPRLLTPKPDTAAGRLFQCLTAEWQSIPTLLAAAGLPATWRSPARAFERSMQRGLVERKGRRPTFYRLAPANAGSFVPPKRPWRPQPGSCCTRFVAALTAEWEEAQVVAQRAGWTQPFIWTVLQRPLGQGAIELRKEPGRRLYRLRRMSGAYLSESTTQPPQRSSTA